MKKGVLILVFVFLLTAVSASAALADVPVRGDPVGACPNANWTLTPLKYADPDQVALDKNVDGWLCVKKNPLTKELLFIDNKY
jgi:hypothetical protein